MSIFQFCFCLLLGNTLYLIILPQSPFTPNNFIPINYPEVAADEDVDAGDDEERKEELEHGGEYCVPRKTGINRSTSLYTSGTSEYLPESVHWCHGSSETNTAPVLRMSKLILTI